MSSVPQLPVNAPFTSDQRAWLNGWIAGVLATRTHGGESAAPPAATLPLTILFGSQTGSAEGLARKLSRQLQGQGFAPVVFGMDEYEKAALPDCERLLIITSTYGEGEPPDNAGAFWTWLNSESAPRFEKSKFSVLALGDTNYEEFCAFGIAVDTRLAALGATRITDRVDCDVEYDGPFAIWSAAATAAFGTAPAPAVARIASEDVKLDAPAGTKANPCPALLTSNQLLTALDAAKETRHFELNINGLTYEPGDAIGIQPSNSEELVDAILQAGGWSGDDALRHQLLVQSDISNPSREMLGAVADRSKNEELTHLLDPARSPELKQWLYGRDVLDLLLLCKKGDFSPAEFSERLKKLQPRLYSIASSLKAAPGHVHLTIAQVRYETFGRARHGVCSTFLADRLNSETPVPVYIQPSHGFKLPADDTTPVIMVGPGTGVAPFRSFLQERSTTGAKGKNWLFFGEQARKQSYFYKSEWAEMVQKGTLTRLDTAFSRDQEQKIYVQHRMIENGPELYGWLEEGAHFYVCGDASRMAKDVDAALHEVISRHGGKSEDEAKAYVAALKSAKRYARDVY